MNTEAMQMVAGQKMMLQVAPDNTDPLVWAEENKKDIDMFLSTHGALLVRGLSIPDGNAFESLLKILFEEELSDYTYRSTPRTQIKNSRVYTASEYHPSETIPQHNENSYANSWPLRIGFLCMKKADRMGNTPISDSRTAYREIPADIREEFERKKVMYVRNYSEIDLPWSEVFQTDEKAVVEKYCRDNNILFEWTKLGLRTRQVNQATIPHPVTKEELWFNQAHLFHVSSLDEEVRENLIELVGEDNLPRNAYFGDGTPIDTEALDLIRGVYERTRLTFQWEEQDLLLLDNMLFTHGREPYQGSRSVFVGMGRKYGKTASL